MSETGIYGSEFAIPGCCSAGFRSNRGIGVDAVATPEVEGRALALRAMYPRTECR